MLWKTKKQNHILFWSEVIIQSQKNIINAQKHASYPSPSLSNTLNNQKLSLGATFLPSPHSTANTARGFVLASPMAPFRSS